MSHCTPSWALPYARRRGRCSAALASPAAAPHPAPLSTLCEHGREQLGVDIALASRRKHSTLKPRALGDDDGRAEDSRNLPERDKRPSLRRTYIWQLRPPRPLQRGEVTRSAALTAGAQREASPPRCAPKAPTAPVTNAAAWSTTRRRRGAPDAARCAPSCSLRRPRGRDRVKTAAVRKTHESGSSGSGGAQLNLNQARGARAQANGGGLQD